MRVERIRLGGRGPLVALCAILMMLIAACGPSEPDDKSDGKGKKDKGDTTKVSVAVVDIAPENGSENVATSGALKVSVREGKLTSVTVKDAEDNEVEGRISKDGSNWQPTGHLGTATRYTVSAVAEDAEGREAARTASFTTVVPKDTFIGYFTPEDGSTVGVGMPVSLNFNRAIANRAAVRDAIEVVAEPSVPVKGHWFGDRRLDFRPEQYWKAGTEVTLKLRLRGVEGVSGIYGTQHKDVKFTVGRSQVSVVDAEAKTMTVSRDGKVIKTIPVTTGAPGTPTWNGKMVISEKHKVTRMDGATVGFGGEYDIPDVPHAIRLSTSGTFLHGNYWAGRSTFGSANTSHGCIGLHDVRGGYDGNTPAAWFYSNSLVGDVVEVKNAKDRIIAPDNGLNGWNMDWSDWGSGQ